MRSMLKSVLAALAVMVALGAIASASASAHEWKKNGEPLTQTEEISIKGGEQIIGAPFENEITCEAITGTGHVAPGAGGKGEMSLHLSGCRTAKGENCEVHTPGEPNGSIALSDLPDQLVTVSGGSGVGDEIQQDPTNREFGVLEFQEKASKACEKYPTTRIKGVIIAEVNNATEALNFPNPGLSGDTFEGFGSSISWFGRLTQELTNGGRLVAA